MKLGRYYRDKIGSIISYLVMMLLIIVMLMAFRVSYALIICVSVTMIIFLVNIIMINYLHKKRFFLPLIHNLERLDKKYLVLETINKPEFYEEGLLYQILYEINKSMCDNVKLYEQQMNDFKEYIEMWIHEVKIPLLSLVLLNNRKKDKKVLEQLKRIEDYVDQVLYYVRCENAHKDYLINEVDLKKIINNVVMKNKDVLLIKGIDIIVDKQNFKVFSDAKWLEFMINQIINNSIKYNDKNKAVIKISLDDKEDYTILEIYDNGRGIPDADLPLVFEKTFTGSNGRGTVKSTGMGLFIVKSLCEKLRHKIEIESILNQYTKVKIIFYKNKFYEVLNK